MRSASLRSAAGPPQSAGALRELGTPEQADPREGSEAVRDVLTRRAGNYVQGDVDGWLAHAQAAHSGPVPRKGRLVG